MRYKIKLTQPIYSKIVILKYDGHIHDKVLINNHNLS